jgi:hypothetical protein
MIESTIVQNGALYLVQHKVPRPRRALFRKLRRAIPKQDTPFRFPITFAQLFRREYTSRWWPMRRLIIGIMSFSPLTTSENEENIAEKRWENEGGNSGELQTLTASEDLVIPILVSTEQAIKWGSHLNTEQHTKLVQTQRTLSKNALAERNMQCQVDLATQSQLLREAAEAFVLPEHNAI